VEVRSLTSSAVSTWTIVVAAGAGSRFGRLKQYEQLGDKRVLDWALEAARTVSEGVVLVVPPDGVGRREPGVDAVVPGAATRSGSVRAGLAAVPPDCDVVVVHDAARPLAPIALFGAVVDAVQAGADAALPGVSPSSTIKRVHGNGRVAETLDRASLVEVQTPQAFRAAALRAAHAKGDEATDDAALVEAAGGSVVVVDGDPVNVKITHPHDLDVVRAIVAGRPA
jgi:2-C-methyl-D-erythritol 4-phosphate cytidylyltransferase